MELPHTHPILLIDNYSITLEDEIIGNYTIPKDHPVLEGHFPHIKIWPGVYLIEGMNQCAGTHALKTAEQTIEQESMVTFVTTVDKVKFRSPAFPGDKLQYHAKLVRKRKNHVLYECTVYKDSLRIANATIGLTAQKI